MRIGLRHHALGSCSCWAFFLLRSSFFLHLANSYSSFKNESRGHFHLEAFPDLPLPHCMCLL